MRFKYGLDDIEILFLNIFKMHLNFVGLVLMTDEYFRVLN